MACSASWPRWRRMWRGSISLGFISDGRYGISKFGWLPGSIDYDGLNLIGIGFLIILLISLLFRRTKVIVIPEPIQVSSALGEFDNSSLEPSNSILIADPIRPRISLTHFLLPGSVGSERSNRHRTGRICPMKAAPVIASKRRRRSRKARCAACPGRGASLSVLSGNRDPYRSAWGGGVHGLPYPSP